MRPGASYMLLCAYLCAGTAVGIILVEMGLPKADLVVGYIFCALLALIGFETVVESRARDLSATRAGQSGPASV